jgi:hypothetical protein
VINILIHFTALSNYTVRNMSPTLYALHRLHNIVIDFTALSSMVPALLPFQLHEHPACPTTPYKHVQTMLHKSSISASTAN